jgi:hypothetical protein
MCHVKRWWKEISIHLWKVIIIQSPDKKENEIFLIYTEIQMGSVAKSHTYGEGLPNIWGNGQIFNHIHLSYMTSQPIPSDISLYMRKIFFSFLSEGS